MVVQRVVGAAVPTEMAVLALVRTVVAVLGLVVVASFVLLTMQHHTLSIACVYGVQRIQ